MIESSSRALILNRIRQALGAAAEPARGEEAQREWRALPRGYRQNGSLTDTERVELFEERLRHYNGTPFHSTGDVAQDIAEILSYRGKRILIVPPAFPQQWLPSGFMFIPDDRLSNEQLNSSDGVVTGCTLAIALTGTLVLESSPVQGRRAATLIPDYHLCVLRKEDILELVPEALRKLEPLKSRPLTFASGPSATVDIEMTRVRGVHGPRTLDVLIL
jgi:L-lactate dehydrogenase complex protein LldG